MTERREDSKKTRFTLIQRAVDLGDSEAWKELYGHYMSFVYFLLNKAGVREDDLEDICQNVFIKLSEGLKG